MNRCFFKQRETGRRQAQTGVEECMQMECGDCEMYKPHKLLSVLHAALHLPSGANSEKKKGKEDFRGYKAPTDTTSFHVDLSLFELS